MARYVGMEGPRIVPLEAGSQNAILGFLSGSIFVNFVWISPSLDGQIQFLSGHGHPLEHQISLKMWI